MCACVYFDERYFTIKGVYDKHSESNIAVIINKNILDKLYNQNDIDIYELFLIQYIEEENEEDKFYKVEFVDEDDIKSIIDCLTEQYKLFEEQKFKIIRKSLRIERYASDHYIYDVADDFYENEIQHIESKCKEIFDIIQKLSAVSTEFR